MGQQVSTPKVYTPAEELASLEVLAAHFPPETKVTVCVQSGDERLLTIIPRLQALAQTVSFVTQVVDSKHESKVPSLEGCSRCLFLVRAGSHTWEFWKSWYAPLIAKMQHEGCMFMFTVVPDPNSAAYHAFASTESTRRWVNVALPEGSTFPKKWWVWRPASS